MTGSAGRDSSLPAGRQVAMMLCQPVAHCMECIRVTGTLIDLQQQLAHARIRVCTANCVLEYPAGLFELGILEAGDGFIIGIRIAASRAVASGDECRLTSETKVQD